MYKKKGGEIIYYLAPVAYRAMFASMFSLDRFHAMVIVMTPSPLPNSMNAEGSGTGVVCLRNSCPDPSGDGVSTVMVLLQSNESYEPLVA